MSDTAQSIIKKAASILHREHLKAHGFRKSGLNWMKSEAWPQLICIQLHRWNTAEDAVFSIGLGVFIQQLHDALRRPSITGSPKVYECALKHDVPPNPTPHRRPGGFIPPQHNVLRRPTITDSPRLFQQRLNQRSSPDPTPGSLHGWRVNLDTQPGELADSMAQRLNQTAAPWFADMNSYESVARELRSNNNFLKAAVVYQFAGEVNTATLMVAKSLRRCHHTAIPHIKDVCRRTGMPFPTT